MKKGIQLLLAVAVTILAAKAQNVGIGTTTPAYDLHITKSSGNVSVYTNAGSSAASTSYTLSAAGALSDFTRWGSTATGTVAGVNVANLTRVWASGSSLMMGTGAGQPLYLATNNTERMRISTDGQFLINTTTPLSANYNLQINGGNRGAAIFLENPVVAANETVSIGRGVPATRFNRTTALHVVAVGDRAIVSEGDNFEAIEATTNSSMSAAGYFSGAGTANLSVELDGFIKVSGTKTAFVHTATAANTTGHITRLSYANPLQTDIVMVTPNYNPPSVTAAYNNHPIGVYWNGAAWTIFNQDIAAITGASFNVMVIRQ